MDEKEKNRLFSLSYWFPITQTLGIPFPETVIIPCSPEDILAAYLGEKPLSQEFVTKLETAGALVGYPAFMRTDLSSGKHNWKNTCFVRDADCVLPNLMMLAEYNEIGRFAYTSIVFREFLDLESSFTAFPGDMPINKERRYFIRDGQVVCHHPYWPPEAFQAGESSDYLVDLNLETDEEIEILTSYAQKVALVLPGYWSVDFAKTKYGDWYLIDMAVGEASYHWNPCEAHQC